MFSEENRFHRLAAGAMNITAGVAVLAALYLLWGIVFGHLDAASAGAQTASADAERLIHNFSLASNVFGLSLALVALLAAFVYFADTSVAYLLVVGAAVIGFGIPYLLTFFVPATADAASLQKSVALRTALGAFPVASVLPGVIGLLLVGKDIFLRFGDLATGRETLVSAMSFGSDAQSNRTAKEKRPMRTGILAKCWEGPYCRENIRPHCPVYSAKAKCWTKKSGCYCDEDIVRTAIQKIEGTLLPMAPEPQFNFSNAALQGVGRQLPQYKKELSWDEKKERCRNCVIYNEHQREKYQIALPATLLASIGGFWLLLPVMRGAVDAGLKSGFAFVQNATPAANAQSVNAVKEAGTSFTSAGTAVGFGPDPILVWVLAVALGVVALAKILTCLEWAIFEKKI